MNKEYFVYLATNKVNTVIYIGLTNDLSRRMDEHKSKANPVSFTARYNVNKLVYYETFEDINDAINREKQIKGWLRIKKIQLITSNNPNFRDLTGEL